MAERLKAPVLKTGHHAHLIPCVPGLKSHHALNKDHSLLIPLKALKHFVNQFPVLSFIISPRVLEFT